MKPRFNSDFAYGKRLARNCIVAAVVFCLLSAFAVPAGSMVQIILTVISTGLMVATGVAMYRYCRCPHCGKHIIVGVLALTNCPRCHRNLTTGQKMKKK